MWGGRRLESLLNKKLPADKSIGESWELFDFPPGVIDASGNWVSSIVANGLLPRGRRKGDRKDSSALELAILSIGDPIDDVDDG